MPFGPVLGEPDLRRQRRMPQHERPTRLWMSRRTQGRSVHVLRKRWERPFALVRIPATDRAFLASKQIEEREAQNSKEENPKNMSSFTSVQLQMGYQELYMNLCMDLEFLTDKKYHSKIVMCTRNSSFHPLKHKSESENNRSYWMKHRFTTLLHYSWYIPFHICFAFLKPNLNHSRRLRLQLGVLDEPGVQGLPLRRPLQLLVRSRSRVFRPEPRRNLQMSSRFHWRSVHCKLSMETGENRWKIQLQRYEINQTWRKYWPHLGKRSYRIVPHSKLGPLSSLVEGNEGLYLLIVNQIWLLPLVKSLY